MFVYFFDFRTTFHRFLCSNSNFHFLICVKFALTFHPLCVSNIYRFLLLTFLFHFLIYLSSLSNGFIFESIFPLAAFPSICWRVFLGSCTFSKFPWRGIFRQMYIFFCFLRLMFSNSIANCSFPATVVQVGIFVEFSYGAIWRNREF